METVEIVGVLDLASRGHRLHLFTPMTIHTYLLTPQELFAVRLRRHYRYFRMKGLVAYTAYAMAKTYASLN